MSEPKAKTHAQKLKEIATELRAAIERQEEAAIQKERADVAHRHATWRVEELIRQTERLGDEHDF